MAASINQAVEAFLTLNQQMVSVGLDEEGRLVWRALAEQVDEAAQAEQERRFRGSCRRKNARAPLQLGFEFVDPRAAGRARTIDLSTGGCALAVAYELAPGAAVAGIIALPEPYGVISVNGSVCWVTPGRTPRKWRVGVAFVDLMRRERDLITSCVLEAVVEDLRATA